MKGFIQKLISRLKEMDTLTKVFLGLFTVLAVATSIVAFQLVRGLTTGMTIIDLPGAPVLGGNKDDDNQTGPQPESAIGIAAPESWDGKSRVTVLLMGLDYSDWREGTTPHSDTMIMLSIDPISKTASMLSIPRDIWISIPGFDHGRINEAYFNGEAYKLPGGGAELARQTVEQFIGVPVQYFAVVDFQAFIRIIDEIGGVKVHPDQPIKIEKEGGAEEQILEPGRDYVIDGELALAYIRERHTQGGDVDRANRQQEVILSVKNQILRYDSLPGLVAKAPVLYEEISSGIRTNLNLSEAIQLGVLALQLDVGNIKRGVINYEMVIPAKSPDGEAILKPIPDKIRSLRDDLFAANGTAGPIAVPAENSTLVRDEAASVVIWDASGQAGLADRTSNYLQSQGVSVVQVADAGGYQPATKIEIFNGKPYTVNFLAQTMGVASANIWNAYDPNVGMDVRVTIGGDWAANNQIP